MKIQIILVLIITVLYSCKQEKETKEVLQEISQVLPYEMGTLTFTNYLSFDTSFSWHHISDATCVGSMKTRFQMKADSIYKETGTMDILPRPKQKLNMTFIFPEFEHCSTIKQHWTMEEIIGKERAYGNDYFIDSISKLKSNHPIYITGLFENWRGSFTIIKVSFLKNYKPLTIVFEKTSNGVDTNFTNQCLKTIESFVLE